jgi:hypothetical protein
MSMTRKIGRKKYIYITNGKKNKNSQEAIGCKQASGKGRGAR